MDPRRFLESYIAANNTHDSHVVLELVDLDATYCFSNGSYVGHIQIDAALNTTWMAIQDESYTISNVEWIAETDDLAICRYHFAWSGLMNGVRERGAGRGTNVLRRGEQGWKVLHEHLST